MNVVRSTIFGGPLTGVLTLLVGAAMTWGYYSESLGSRVAAVIFNVGFVVAAKLTTSEHESLGIGLGMVLHFLIWWCVYIAGKRLIIGPLGARERMGSGST